MMGRFWSDWTKLAGFTDSICCTKDNPSSNCETSGANDFIEITGAAEPPVSDVFKVNTEPYSAILWCHQPYSYFLTAKVLDIMPHTHDSSISAT